MSSWILYRYCFRRWTAPILGALIFFIGFMVAFEIKVLAQEIGKIPGASFRWLLPLLFTTLPETLFMVLPLGALLGSLMGMQQLSESSEWVSSQGLGAGPGVILRPWLLLASGLLVLASLNAHLLVPKMAMVQSDLRRQMVDEGMRQALRPGGKPFYPDQDKGMALWMSPEGQVHHMYVQEETVQHLVAERLTWSQDAGGSGEIILNLHDLNGATLRRKDETVLQTHARLHQMRWLPKADGKLLKPLSTRYLPTGRLWAKRDRESWVELSRRITLPLSIASFLLLGIGMGMSHPRFHKGGALIKSLGVGIAYFVLMRFGENRFLAERWSHPASLFLLPLLMGLLAATLVWLRLRPHHSNRYTSMLRRWTGQVGHSAALTLCQRVFRRCSGGVQEGMGSLRAVWARLGPSRFDPLRRRGPVFEGWATRGWMSRWLGTMAVFLSLSLTIEFANLAGELSTHKAGFGVFLQFWVWNLPLFLSVVFPLAFLFAGVLMCSDAATSHEWVAIRASGSGILRWLWSARWAWMSVLAATFLLQVVLAPIAGRKADALYNRIRNRPAPVYRDTRPWMLLSSHGLLWHLEEGHRWGFPLRPVGTAPMLISIGQTDAASRVLPWKSMAFQTGPAARDLFPDPSLQRFAKVDHVPTRDLMKWQRWAPDSNQATLLWTRLLGWLAGPCLLFAALAHAFPAPRQGRGQALGYALVAGLAYTGLQLIFIDAARLGELPAIWGVIAPMLAAVAVGLLQLPRLRT